MAKRKRVTVNVLNVNVNASVDAGPKFNPEKRQTLSVLTAFVSGVISSMVGTLAMRPVEKLIGLKELTPDDDAQKVAYWDQAHAALTYALFLGSGALKTQYLPPTDWYVKSPDVFLGNDQYTYGHEAEVLRSITRFLCHETLATWVPTTIQRRPDPLSSHVLLGSGASNRLTRRLIGTPWEPQFEAAGLKLHYTITQGDGTILKRCQYYKEHAPKAHAICRSDETRLLQPQVRDGWQQDDFLVVTRMPGNISGTDRTIFAGLHGPGTRSAELLFTSLSMRDLEHLASAIDFRPGRTPHFQAVFRASHFKELNGSHVPTSIELVTDTCPPLPLDTRA